MSITSSVPIHPVVDTGCFRVVTMVSNEAAKFEKQSPVGAVLLNFECTYQSLRDLVQMHICGKFGVKPGILNF